MCPTRLLVQTVFPTPPQVKQVGGSWEWGHRDSNPDPLLSPRAPTRIRVGRAEKLSAPAIVARAVQGSGSSFVCHRDNCEPVTASNYR